MKFLHLADLHIGKIVNSYNLIEDQRFALEGILDVASARQVDALVLAGDIYDKAQPSAEAIALVDWLLTETCRRGIKILGIPGNHDSDDRVAYAQGILKNQGVFFPPRFDGNVAHVELVDGHGPVTFWLLPFLKPAHVRPYFPDVEIGSSYTEALRCVLEACEIDRTQRNVLVAHQFVTATGAETERTASELNLGGVDDVDASVFDVFDYVALGHVHRPQRIGRDTCRYAGSLLKYSFSEARFPKSAVLVTLDEKKAGEAVGSCIEFELVDYPVLHDLRKVKGPLDDLTNSELVPLEGRNDYLHVTLTDEFAHPDALARIRATYPNVMAIDREVTTPAGLESSRATTNPDELDPLKLFGDFFQAQMGKIPSDLQRDIAKDAMDQALETTAQGADESSAANEGETL